MATVSPEARTEVDDALEALDAEAAIWERFCKNVLLVLIGFLFGIAATMAVYQGAVS